MFVMHPAMPSSEQASAVGYNTAASSTSLYSQADALIRSPGSRSRKEEDITEAPNLPVIAGLIRHTDEDREVNTYSGEL